MNQAACNSLHFVFWIGENDKIKETFWYELDKIVQKKFILDEKVAVDKYTHLIKNIIDQKNLNNIKMYKNNIYLIDVDDNINNIENIRGVNGIFFQKNIKNLDNLKNYITKKCQTITYFGIHKHQIRFFLLKNNLFGVDRMVPIGKGLEMSLTWDGYDLIKSLSRIININ